MPVSSHVVVPGALHLSRYLSVTEQCTVAARCLELGSREAGFYTPIVRGGHPMSVRMLCLGRHWNAPFVFGGPARLRYHGVSGVLPGTAPAGLPLSGRLNLTFRKF